MSCWDGMLDYLKVWRISLGANAENVETIAEHR